MFEKAGFVVDEEQLLRDAVRNGWQKEDGTALHNVGRHLENCGPVVSRRYKCVLDDIVKALGDGSYVIAAVDGENFPVTVSKNSVKMCCSGRFPIIR